MPEATNFEREVNYNKGMFRCIITREEERERKKKCHRRRVDSSCVSESVLGTCITITWPHKWPSTLFLGSDLSLSHDSQCIRQVCLMHVYAASALLHACTFLAWHLFDCMNLQIHRPEESWPQECQRNTCIPSFHHRENKTRVMLSATWASWSFKKEEEEATSRSNKKKTRQQYH